MSFCIYTIYFIHNVYIQDHIYSGPTGPVKGIISFQSALKGERTIHHRIFLSKDAPVSVPSMNSSSGTRHRFLSTHISSAWEELCLSRDRNSPGFLQDSSRFLQALQESLSLPQGKPRTGHRAVTGCPRSDLVQLLRWNSKLHPLTLKFQ